MRLLNEHDVAGAVTVHVVGAVPGGGVGVTVYVAGGPPELGAVTVTVAEVAPVTAAVGCPGCPGGASGVTAVEAADAAEVPALFVAVEVNVYDVPFVSGDTTHEVAGEVTVQVAPPGEAVTR